MHREHFSNEEDLTKFLVFLKDHSQLQCILCLKINSKMPYDSFAL